MSASLVGSEMCIRDRLQPTLSEFKRCYALSLCFRCLATIVLLHWAAAVSYTHLTLPTICSV
eukprot:8284162-Alexandrium_andersonii.AAC.1